MNNKKAIAAGVLVGMIIIFVSFFLYLFFFVNISKGVVSEADDISCRAYISLKSFPGIKFGEFFYKINEKCFIDEIKNVNLEKKDESFKIIGDEMARCWYRYGEGEQDFLSNWDTTGNWCFLCGVIELEDNSESISYKEFVEWTTNNKINESMTYSQYINLRYTDVDDKQVKEFRVDIEELLSEPDLSAEVKPMIMVLGEQVNYLDDLRFKQIKSSDEKIYVVYRYDRLAKSTTEKMSDAGRYAIIGSMGSILAGAAAEGVAEAAIFGGGGAIIGGPLGGAIGGVFGFVKGSVKSVYTSAKAVARVTRILKLMDKAKDLVKSTKKLEQIEESVEIGGAIITVTKEEAKLVEKIRNFKASSKEIEEFAKLAEGTDPKIAQALNNIADSMKNYNIEDLSKIDSKILNSEKNGKKLYEEFEATIDSITDSDLERLAAEETKIFDEVENLRKLRDLAKNEIGQIKTGKEIDTPGLRDYLRTIAIVGSGAGVGVVGAELNDNYEQYVDLMTQEQYYRLCGTEGKNFN